MINLGTVRPGETIYIPFETFASSSGAPITLTGLATSDILVYKDGGTTQRASASGFTLLDTDGIDFDGITGIHGFSIDLSDNTTADFWAAGSKYFVVISTVTVDSQTMSFVAATFRIGYTDAIHDTTIATLSSQTSFTLTAGPADDNALVGCIALIHDAASAVQRAIGVVSAYTGSTKTVTLAADPAIFTMAAKDNISFFVPSNTRFVGGAVQTARDIGASVLPASGSISRATFAADTGLQTTRSNTAQSANNYSITLDASASSVTNYYLGQIIYITGGAGVGQSRIITSYDGSSKVANVNFDWKTNPDNTSTFAILNPNLFALNYVYNSVDTIDSRAADLQTQIGVAGSGLTAIGDTRLNNLDATISSRMATYTQPTGFLGATFPATVASTTNITTVGAVAGLTPSNLDVAVSTRLASSSYTVPDNSTIAAIYAAIGAFTGTGVNTIFGFFKALFRTNATLPSDIGGTYDPTTDSLEAQRDNTGTAGAGLTVITAKTNNLPSDPADASDIAASFATLTTYVDTLETVSGQIKAKTDLIGTSNVLAANAIDATTLTTAAANKLADITLRRNFANVEASSFGDTLSIDSIYGISQRSAHSDTTTTANKITVFKTDDTTVLGTITITSTPTGEVITSAKAD